jgi:hypothetical protein
MHYDRGGLLRPGLTLAWNQTGQNEHVYRPGGRSSGGGGRRGGGPIYVTLQVAGQQVEGVIRGIARQEIEDEFGYQAAGI